MKEPSLYNSYSASLTADKIKPALVIRHRFDLAGEQIYACWRLRLVGMEDVKKTIAGDPASSFLPNATHLALALLEKVALPGDAVVFVTLQLVEGVTSSPTSALRRWHIVNSLKIWSAAQNCSQIQQTATILVLLLLDLMQLLAEVADVCAEVLDRL